MSEQIISAVTRSYKSMADGTLRLSIDIEPNDAPLAVTIFGKMDTPIAIAKLTIEAAQADLQNQSQKIYGMEAQKLKQSGFFRAPDVWKAISCDDAYLLWLKSQPCAFRSAMCAGDIVAAHVRRIANGAGVGIKPEFSAVPCCNYHHQLQHQKGESVVAPKEYWDKQRIHYVESFMWQTLKAQLGYESWSMVPPSVLHDWAVKNDLVKYLPADYRAAA